jgi:hypothetical protein
VSTRAILALCVVLALLGWFALASFTYHNPPQGWNRWIAVAILGPTLWTSLLPIAYAFHRRAEREEEVVLIAARQGALASLYLTICLGLRLVQALNWANALLLLALFVLTEILLSTRGNQ